MVSVPDTERRATRFLRLQEVLARTGLGRTTIYKMVSRGDFPQPRKLTNHVNGWIEWEVEEWARQRDSAEIGAGSEAEPEG